MKRFFQLTAFLIIGALLGYQIGVNRVNVNWQNYKPIVNIQSKNPPSAQNLDMTLFYDVLDKVTADYYDKSKIDTKKITYGAITGMLQSLGDPYTSFFPPKENTDFKTQLAGEFQGIGAELGMNAENRIIIISPLDESPAQKAGIKAGDVILKVDGTDTNTWTLSQAVDKIRGPKGSEVTLTIGRDKEEAKDYKIARDVIIIKSVTSWLKNVGCNGNACSEQANAESSVAYIRLSQFGDKTNDEWIQAINSLNPKISQQKNFKGIILDLRNNPGGYLKDAAFIASEFIKDGVVVIQEDGKGGRETLDVMRKGSFTDFPVVVLINGGSASASEIVAGALRDRREIKLVGEKSFGKGTVQEALDVDTGASVHISIAKWLTPNGTWVNKNGLEPDVKVKYEVTKDAGKSFDNQLQAAVKELLK